MLVIDHVYKKLRTVEQLPRRGRRISLGTEAEHLGQFVCGFPGGYELWRDRLGLSTSYNVFDPEKRRVELTMHGTRFISNPSSFIIFGVYARPGNQVRAIELYEFLIRRLGLTLISDRNQSPGGQRVWKQLHRKHSLNVYGYNFRTNQVIDVSGPRLKDAYVTVRELETAKPGTKKALKSRAANIRLVACLA